MDNSNLIPISFNDINENIIITWGKYIKLESNVRKDQRLGKYVTENKEKQGFIISPVYGKIVKIIPGDIPSSPIDICTIKICEHEKAIDSLCTACGQKVEHQRHAIIEQVLEESKGFSFNPKKSEEMTKEARQLMLTSQKLILILDLDNTLIHSHLVKDYYTFDRKDMTTYDTDLYFMELPPETYYVKLRPYIREFLEAMISKFIIYIYTMGTRNYALYICKLIDPESKYIKEDRIISRCDNGEDGNERKILEKISKDLSTTLILDDNQIVWPKEYAKNIIYTKPYYYFQDIFLDNKFDQIVKIRRKQDAFLYFMRELILKIHDIYFELLEKGIDIHVGDIYKTIHNNLLKDVHIVFSGLFKSDINLKYTEESRMIEDLGGKLDMDIDNKTTYLLCSYAKKTIKINKARKMCIPVINKWWLSYTGLYCKRLNVHTFDLSKENVVLLEAFENSFNSIKEKANNNKSNDTGKSEEKIIVNGESTLHLSSDIPKTDINLDANTGNGSNDIISSCSIATNFDIKSKNDQILQIELTQEYTNITKELSSTIYISPIIQEKSENKSIKSHNFEDKDHNQLKDLIEEALIKDNPYCPNDIQNQELKNIVIRILEMKHKHKRIREE